MKQSPEAKATKLSVSKQACHQIAGLATSILLATWLAWCKPQDANAQTAPPVVEAEMPEGVIKTAQLSQTTQPKVINASFSVPEESVELDIPTLESEIETVETRIAELEAKWVDSLGDDEFDMLLDFQEKRDDLRKQVVILEKQEAYEAEARVEESSKKVEESRKTRKAMEEALSALWSE